MVSWTEGQNKNNHKHDKVRLRRRAGAATMISMCSRACQRLGVQYVMVIALGLWTYWRSAQVPDLLIESATISSFNSSSENNKVEQHSVHQLAHDNLPRREPHKIVNVNAAVDAMEQQHDNASMIDDASVSSSLTTKAILSNTWIPTDDILYEVCFVTASYSKSLELADRPPDVTSVLEENPSFQFFAFTNLPYLDAPGWNIIVKDFKHNTTHSQFRRFITQSRWPKFMAWNHHKIQQCQGVFYMDAYCAPKSKHAKIYKKLANTLANSQYGLAQNKHEYSGGNLFQEFERIIAKHKDIPANVYASLTWLKAQPDFNPNCTMYENHFIAYNPRNEFVQRAMKFFWDHYSLEQDSWRDQPLWCYVLDRYNITPTRLGTSKKLFREYFKRMGPGGHRYNQQTENNGLIVSSLS